ncbi:hypothetical protein ACFYXV_33845 [Streptomyces sp. NPDC002181]|uniref:hypothetical protein n=1 Tax=Streptomyces sp. NPDC002181 TaxID=3364635 RepID=UPI0036C83CF6
MIENPWTPAHQAVESSDHAELIRLLDEGADVNEVCWGMTLLEHAINLEGDSALQSGNPIDSRLTAILLAYGADPRPQPPGAEGAMHLADHYGHDIARRLINLIYDYDQDAHFDTTQLREGLAHRMPPAQLDEFIAAVEATGDQAVDLDTAIALLYGTR